MKCVLSIRLSVFLALIGFRTVYGQPGASAVRGEIVAQGPLASHLYVEVYEGGYRQILDRAAVAQDG